MNVRPHIALDAICEPRPSARVARVAQILDCDPSDVRRMLRDGELEGHGKGIRGKRVYLDSVAAYQEARTITPKAPKSRLRAQRAGVSRAAQGSALAALRKAGLLR